MVSGPVMVEPPAPCIHTVQSILRSRYSVLCPCVPNDGPIVNSECSRCSRCCRWVDSQENLFYSSPVVPVFCFDVDPCLRPEAVLLMEERRRTVPRETMDALWISDERDQFTSYEIVRVWPGLGCISLFRILVSPVKIWGCLIGTSA